MNHHAPISQADGYAGPSPHDTLTRALSALIVAGHDAGLCCLDVLVLVELYWDTYPAPEQAADDRITG